MLKADFHTHTSEDPYDGWFINYSAKDLIRLAAKQKFDVLSITLHNRVFFNEELRLYAKKKGILLIPGAEPQIQGKDVLLVNVSNNDLKKIRKIDDLDKLKESALVIAPHPYFMFGDCLEGRLVKNIDKFDAIEFSHFYTKALLNPIFRTITGNPKAIAVAEKYHKPLVGTSDCHKLYEFGTTYTLIDSPKKVDDVIDAVKRNKIKLETRPMSVQLFMRRITSAVFNEGFIKSLLKKKGVPSMAKDKFFKTFK